MQVTGVNRIPTELRGLIVEASLALARLDADRLEELAQCCRALNGGSGAPNPDACLKLGRQAHAASSEMEIFGRVLDATRANLEVMNRVRQRRRSDLEYPAGRRIGRVPWSLGGACDGNR